MKGAILGAVVGSLLLIPSTPAIAVYPKAADIKRACASVIWENFKGTTMPKAEQDQTVDGWIDSYSEMSTEKARSEWTGWGGNDASKCVIDRLEIHRREGNATKGTGRPVPPLRPTAKLAAHNPANDASQCLELITKRDFDRRGVKNTTGAVFNNRCAYPVETRWCIGADRCARGYDNLATMPASHYRGISYDAKAGVKTETRWAGCRLGFAHRADFAGTLHYACK